MKGFEQAYEGRLLVGLPSELVDEMAKVGGGSFVLRMRQGNQPAIAKRPFDNRREDGSQQTRDVHSGTRPNSAST